MIDYKNSEVTEIWKLYQMGLSYLRKKNIPERTRKCFQFTEGDQWEGLKSGAERPAQLNILHPIMKNATALVGQNNMTIHYSSMNYEPEIRHTMEEICAKLNQYAARVWERTKMDHFCWNVLQDAYICGDSFTYFYDDAGEIACEMLNNVNVMLADEQNDDIQKQPYLLITRRSYVDQIKKEARANGISEDDISLIMPDEAEEEAVFSGQDDEVQNGQKCMTVTKLWKKDGVVHIARATRRVTFERIIV